MSRGFILHFFTLGIFFGVRCIKVYYPVMMRNHRSFSRQFEIGGRFKKGLVCFAGTKLTLCNTWSYEIDVLYVESSFELKATFCESFDITLYDNTAYLFNPHFDAYVLYVK